MGRATARSSLLLLAVLASPVGAEDRAPGFLSQTISLPGIPAAMLPADLTGDGRDDLVVLVAYTGWTTRSEFAPAQFDEIEGLVEVMNVIDELVERRELRLYPARPEAEGFGAALAAVDLERSVHALAAGHPAEPLIAVTDRGAAAVRLVAAPDGANLELTPLVTGETSFAGDARLYPNLELLHDLDGDGLPELLLPTPAGWAVHRGTASGFAADPAAVLSRPEPIPGDEQSGEGTAAAKDEGQDGDSKGGEEGDSGGGGNGDSDGNGNGDSDGNSDGDEDPQTHGIRFEVRDCSGDGRPDVVLPGGVADSGPLIYRNAGGLAFAEAVGLRLDAEGEADREVTFVGDLDGDDLPEAVVRTELERYQDPGWRQEVDEAKRPLFGYAVHPLGPDLTVGRQPRYRFRATGYTFGGSGEEDEEEILLPGGFQDLDGDGRQDLVAITLEFSILPLAMRVLIVQRISLTMNFHVWCQGAEGGLREVPGLDLSGKFKLNLRNLRIRHLSQFAGDFDGDGRADFVQLGRGKRVTIHLGRAGCRYPPAPDRAIRLARKLRHLGLARIDDLDGDKRSDIYVVHPLKADDEGVSIPARVDLYLSRF